MKKQKEGKKTSAKKNEATLTDFFKLIDDVAKKSRSDSDSKKIIESATEKWQSYSKYAI